MIIVFHGYSKNIHKAKVRRFSREGGNQFRLIYDEPDKHWTCVVLDFSKNPHDILSYMEINGIKYDIDNMEKNYEKIQMLIEQEKNMYAIEALP